jgi:hypothetical protein
MNELHRGHLFDEDACCVDCGFDGAEWRSLLQYTTGMKAPLCTKIGRKHNMWLERATDWEDDYWKGEYL